MDILKKLLALAGQQKLFSILLLVIASISFAVGMYYKVFTNHIDSPIEQAAEAVIEQTTGIDIDFSDDKKH